METSNIKIKGYANGLIVEYSGTMTLPELYDITKKKFASSRKFLGNSTVCIVFRGVELTQEQESQLAKIIEDNSDLDIACVYHEYEAQVFDDCINIVADLRNKDVIYFAKEDIENDRVIKSKNDVVIIGDVPKDACIISDKSIYIVGSLYGEAYAGKKDVNSCIFAMGLKPYRMGIGEVFDTSSDTVRKTSIFSKNKNGPQIAYLKDNKLVVEPYTNELIRQLR